MNGWRRPVHESAYDKAPLEELEEEGELIRESPAAAAKRAQQFATVKELLMTAVEHGTS